MKPAKSFSRRAFLKRSGAVASALFAAPIIIPSHVIGANPPSETVTIGMIGTGRQCYYKNIPLFQRQPDCRIVAVCDVDSWRMGEAKKQVDEYNRSKHGITTGCGAYADYQDLLARNDIQAVMISTPDHWHGKMALDAMQAGKDVALEKPIIRTIREGQQLVKPRRSTIASFVSTASSALGCPARRAYSIVKSGALGNIHTSLRVCSRIRHPARTATGHARSRRIGLQALARSR